MVGSNEPGRAPFVGDIPGSGHVGALNGIGAEIRASQIGTGIASQKPFVEQLLVEVGAEQTCRLLSVRGQVADCNPDKVGERIC